jgi:hypothetical protein
MRGKMKLVISICLLLFSCAKENILPPDWADETNPVYWEGNILFGKQIVAYGDAVKLSRKDNIAKDDAEKLATKKALIKISKKISADANRELRKIVKDNKGSTSNIVGNILSSIENKIKNSLITEKKRTKHQYIEKNNHMFVQVPIKKKVVINFIQRICREVFVTEVLSDKDLIGKICIKGKVEYCIENNTKLEQAMLIVQKALKNIDENNTKRNSTLDGDWE